MLSYFLLSFSVSFSKNPFFFLSSSSLHRIPPTLMFCLCNCSFLHKWIGTRRLPYAFGCRGDSGFQIFKRCCWVPIFCQRMHFVFRSPLWETICHETALHKQTPKATPLSNTASVFVSLSYLHSSHPLCVKIHVWPIFTFYFNLSTFK